MTGTNGYIWAFAMAQVKNMLTIWLTRTKLAVTIFSKMCHLALVYIAVLRNNADAAQTTRSNGKHHQQVLKDHFPASIPNASQVPEVQSLGTIIQPLFSPDSIAQLLYYAETIQELTNSTHLCLSHRQDSRQQLFWYTVVSEVLQTAAVSAHTMHPGPKT